MITSTRTMLTSFYIQCIIIIFILALSSSSLHIECSFMCPNFANHTAYLNSVLTSQNALSIKQLGQYRTQLLQQAVAGDPSQFLSSTDQTVRIERNPWASHYIHTYLTYYVLSLMGYTVEIIDVPQFNVNNETPTGNVADINIEYW